MTEGKDLQRSDPAGPPARPAPHFQPSLDEHLGGGVPIGEYLEALRRYAWVIVVAVLGALGVTLYRISQEPDRYYASASVRLVDQRPALTGGLAQSWGDPTLGGWTDPISTEIEVLKSRAVVEAVVDESGYRLRSLTPELTMDRLVDVAVLPGPRPDTLFLDFRQDGVRISGGSQPVSVPYGTRYDQDGIGFTIVGRPPDVDEARLLTVSAEAAIAEVSGGLVITPRNNTTIIDIGFFSYDPTAAMRVTNAAALVFERTSTTTTQQQSARRREFITDQLRATDSVLVDAENRLIEYRRGQSGQLTPGVTSQGDPARMVEAQRQRADFRTELDLYQRLLDGIGSAGGLQRVYGLLTSPELRQNSALAEVAGDLIRLSAQRDSLTQGVVARTAQHPEVQRLDTLIQAARQRFTAAVQGHEILLRARLASLDRELARGTTDLARRPGDEIEESRLAREVETVRTLSDKLREELQAARISEAVEIGDVQVIDLAPFGGGPIGKGRKRKLLFGGLVGLMFGGLAAIGLDRINTTIRHRDEIERVLRLSALATIPQISPVQPRARAWLPALGRDRKPAPRLDMGVAPLGTISSSGLESFRKLMANLIFTPEAHLLKTLVVTSPLASEGKTTTATHLALAFAQHGRRVLLVDADLRRGRLHQIFRVDRTPGLSEVIIGNVSVGEALRATSEPNLTVMTTGAPPVNPLEFLGSSRMKKFIEGASERFDLVILDTAPVLLAADSVALAAAGGGVLLVVRAGATQRASARQARQQLDAVGARILGAVLNDADSRMSGYVYYSAYYDVDAVTEVPVGGASKR